MISIILVAGLLAVIVGVAVVIANPHRFTNQVFGFVSAIVTLYLVGILAAVLDGLEFEHDHVTSAVPALRIVGAVSMFFPWALWLLRESLVSETEERLHVLRRSLSWFVLGIVLAGICFTNAYYPDDSLPDNERHGALYLSVSLINACAYGFLVVQSWFQMRKQRGIRRMEVQFFVLNATLAASLVTVIGICAVTLNMGTVRRLGPMVIVASYVIAAWAFAHYRIFNVRQVSVVIAQKTLSLALLGLGSWLVWRFSRIYVADSISFLCGIVIVGAICLVFERLSREWIEATDRHELVRLRLAAIKLASKEPHPSRLAGLFEALLRGHCHSSRVIVLLDDGQKFRSAEFEVEKKRLGYGVLCEIGWVTPESLSRRRKSDALLDLKCLLGENELSLVIAVPRGSTNPTLLLALGTKENEWPFTYPEVERLQNIAELMDNILTRSRLTLQAAVQAKMEHLAMMSRGLAHDLNNLITPISSFLVHTDERFPAQSVEHEVHAAARRSVRIMGDYVREALFFAEKLTPKFEPVDIVRVFQEVRALTAARASERGVTLETEVTAEIPVIADGVLLQRMLTNLISNSLDASAKGQCVVLSAKPGRNGGLCLEVTDQGQGISPENLGRIFDPYFTTKNYGDDLRGFGLGLTICQKIVHLHGGNISVTSELGHGTNIVINLPENHQIELRAV